MRFVFVGRRRAGEQSSVDVVVGVSEPKQTSALSDERAAHRRPRDHSEVVPTQVHIEVAEEQSARNGGVADAARQQDGSYHDPQKHDMRQDLLPSHNAFRLSVGQLLLACQRHVF